MYVRNLLAAGDYMLTVPAGLNITIQYDERGQIQHLLLGLSPEGVMLPDEVMAAVLPAEILPRTILVQQGTTWVSGVLVRAGNFSTSPGQLPEDFEEELAAQFVETPEVFHFYAAIIQSTAVKFTPGLTSTRWLTNAGFDVLSNYVVPATLSDEQFSKMLSGVPDGTTAAGVLVLHGGQWSYVSLEARQDIVKSVSMRYDNIGYLKGHIQFESGESLVVDYNDIVTWNIQAKSLVLYAGGSIIGVSATDNKYRAARAAKISCPVCGASLNVVPEMMCSNLHCPSRYYENVRHFLNVLNLPVLSHDEFASAFTKTVSFNDVLELPQYCSQTVSATIYQLVRAAVPLTAVRSDAAIIAFCEACNNTVMSVEYHLQHIDRIATDLGLDERTVSALMPLCADTALIEDIVQLLHNSHINLSRVETRFEGAPIFRNKRICITGTFTHGSLSEVAAILRSYSAEITDNVLSANCLIVGDGNEGTRGDWIRTAKSHNIPIFAEAAFFRTYEIDEDLAVN